VETPLLVLKDFGVSYGRRVVLDRLDLTLPAQGIDVLMGPVKAGKSSLKNTLAGRYIGHPLHRSWGEIHYAGAPLAETRPPLVSQHVRSPEVRLLDALLKPLRDSGSQGGSPADWRERGLAWLEAGGLAACIPQAQAPLLDQPPHLRRAVLILAQMQLGAPLLMIDEPTFDLEERDALWLIDWLRSQSGTRRLWVTLHNQIQARRLADRVILLGGGRIVAHQSSNDFFQNPANEWVSQFIRSGSLALPAPDARAEDLDGDSRWPLLGLSDAARSVVENFAPAGAVARTAPVAAPAPAAASAASSTAVAAAVSTEVSSKPAVTGSPAVSSAPAVKPAATPAPVAAATPAPVAAPKAEPVAPRPAVASAETLRRPVALPLPGGQGVELAAMVGDTILKDHSAPRGFHWIIPGKMAGCSAPGVVNAIDYDLAVLQRMGITYLITLTETNLDQGALRRFGLKNLHLPIFDREAPSNAQTHMLLVRMERLLSQGEVLAVHCKAGLGRTGTILAAWMIRDGGFTAIEAIRRLRLIEPGFIQSQEQEQFLADYENDLTLRLT
jgi:atypical dual specificity phosphatase